MAALTSPRSRKRTIVVTAAIAVAVALVPAVATAAVDPRPDLAAGYFPYSDASSNVQLLDNDPRVAPFDAPPGNFGFVNSDLAFTGEHAVAGNFNGFQIYDLSDPANPDPREFVRLPRWTG